MNSKQKNILIGGLLTIVLILGVAYAAFQSQLNITGTTSIDSKWDVRITSITPDKKATNSGTEASPNYTTAGDISHSITNNDLTANFAAGLVSPGDTVVYTIKVKNNGTLNAALNTLTKTPSTNPAITFEVSGIEQNDILNAGAEKEFTVTVAYANVESQPTSTTASFSLTLNFVQTNDNAPAGGGSGLTGTFYRKNSNKLFNNKGVNETIQGYYNSDIYSNVEEAIGSWDFYDTLDGCGNEKSCVSDSYTISIGDYTKDDASAYGKNYLKYIIENDIVKASYVCFITDKEYCMQGGDSSYYTANKRIFEGNGQWFTNNSGSCYDGGSYFNCIGGGFSSVSADSTGYVNADASGVNCYVNDVGISQCW